MAAYRVPSVAKLADVFKIDDDTARLVRRVLHGEIDPCEACDRTAAWVRQCYHDPPWDAQAQHAADALLEGHGIEAVWGDDEMVPACTYSNQGDTYTATLVFRGNRAELTTLGDIVESLERRGVEVKHRP